jgi:hypothetical protein
MVAMEKQFIADVRSAALEFKKKSTSVEDAAKQLGADLKAKLPRLAELECNGVCSHRVRRVGYDRKRHVMTKRWT